eukprot:scaffold72251_cov106-Phaeocystis_antarctica.AAC.2
MPRTALELPDSSEQKTRLVVRDDPPLLRRACRATLNCRLQAAKHRLRAATRRYSAAARGAPASMEC